MKPWKVNCLTTRIERALTAFAKENGWKDPGIVCSEDGNYDQLGMMEDGEIIVWNGLASYVDHETISIEEAYKRLEAGPPKPPITLKLTWEEAKTLRDVAAKTSGNRETTRRRYMHSIAVKLQHLGVGDYNVSDISRELEFAEK